MTTVVHDTENCPACVAAKDVLTSELEADPSAFGTEALRGVQHLLGVLFGPHPDTAPPEMAAPVDKAQAVGDVVADFLEHKGYASPNVEELGRCAIAAVRHVGEIE